MIFWLSLLPINLSPNLVMTSYEVSNRIYFIVQLLSGSLEKVLRATSLICMVFLFLFEEITILENLTPESYNKILLANQAG